MKRTALFAAITLDAVQPAKGQTPPPQAKAFEVTQQSTVLKAESIYNTATGQSINNLLGFGQDLEGSLYKNQEEYPWKIRYRLWAAQETPQSLKTPEEKLLEKLIAHISTSLGATRITVGYQELTWGENLLMPVLDVVNPRNIAHPYGYYDPAAKIPQFLIVAEWPFETFKLDLIANPFPTSMRHPDKILTFNVNQPDPRPQGLSSAEFGTRITFVTDSLETRFYGYRHGARAPSYTFLPYSSGGSNAPDIQADEGLTNTYGISSSFASYEWLLRGDLAIHQDYPATNISTKTESTTTTQWILGLSTITMDQQSLGVELHGESWERGPLAYDTNAFVDPQRDSAAFYWGGIIANLNFLKAKIQPNIVYFHGINSADNLIRIDTSYSVDDHSTVLLGLLRTQSKTSSPKLLLSQRDALSLRWTLVF